MIDSNPALTKSTRPVAIVTGGSSGIGKATAARFVQQGWHTVICGRDTDRLGKAVEELKAIDAHFDMTHVGVPEDAGIVPIAENDPNEEPRVGWHQTDVRRREEIEKLASEVHRMLGRIDVWVNNAGVAPMESIADLSDDDFSATIQTNVAPVFQSTRVLWPIFRAQRAGVIINISSLAATDPFPGFSLYGASKAWVNLFTQATAAEGEADGIRIYAVAPGAVDTPLLRGLFPDFPDEQTLEPEQIADCIWTLCQSDHDMPSGTTVEVSAQ